MGWRDFTRHLPLSPFWHILYRVSVDSIPYEGKSASKALRSLEKDKE